MKHCFRISVLACLLPLTLLQAVENEVHRVERLIPPLPKIEVRDSAKFLNDLKLSPFWHVPGGKRSSTCRTMNVFGGKDSTDEARFLFEFFLEKPLEKRAVQMSNGWVRAVSGATLSASVHFQKPSNVPLCEADKQFTLPVTDWQGAKLDLNSRSALAWKICPDQEIYLVISESGADPRRDFTWSKLPLLARHLANIAALPASYSVSVQYGDFFDHVFKQPWGDHALQRISGLQDRDTFYGFIKVQTGFDYEGVNVRISHPVYCDGECTRKTERLRKAEALGSPYVANDRLFFLIGDNAVYLQGNYDKQFGTFSGNTSFDGKLEILDARERLLFEATLPFKGWER
jgi:hypothetical protein